MSPITRLDQADRLTPGLAPRVRVLLRDVSLLIYLHEGVHCEDYDACCQVQILGGTRGHMHSLTGSGFYLAWDKIIEAARGLHLETLEGYVREPHARLIERLATRRGASVVVQEPIAVHGMDMRWVCVELGSAQT